ncbi:hypothetical protein EA004_23100, partial [Vibrio anguillarum]|nr:hypothetical protein [Vibrio anguillarum]
MTYDELIQEFCSKGIKPDAPDFYDQESFLEQERMNNNYLNLYSMYVAKQPYSKEYLERSKKVITKTVEILYEALLKTERKGACIDISSVLVRVLEKQGIWSTCLKGSCVVDFSTVKSGIPSAYFYSVTDDQESTPGHFWVYAPPFEVIDISIGEQGYNYIQLPSKPAFVLSEGANSCSFDISEMVKPNIRTAFLQAGYTSNDMMKHMFDGFELVNKVFPSFEVVNNSVKIKYIPTATHASGEKLEG